MKLLKTKNKNLIIAGAVIILVFIIGFVWFRNLNGSDQKERAVKESTLDNSEVYPAVDANVEVSLRADSLKRRVTLGLGNIPENTNSIDYELSYIADGDLPKGVIGTIELKGDTSIEEDEITLGTCSSGSCVYDKGVKEINVALKYNGSYGSRIFEKSFKI